MKNLLKLLVVSLTLSTSMVCAQNNTLTSFGKITDIDGNPIKGVKVLYKAKTGDLSVESDSTGRFTIKGLPSKGAMLQFIKDGYVLCRQKVSTSNELYITMPIDNDSQNVEKDTGYGTSSKSRKVSSNSSVSGDDIRKSGFNQNTIKGLAGRISGLGPDLKIRGASNYPLFVINGVISDKNTAENLNAEDIESAEVLKDAASLAVYGSRGADGVVVIRTKSGTKKSNTKTPAKAK